MARRKKTQADQLRELLNQEQTPYDVVFGGEEEETDSTPIPNDKKKVSDSENSKENSRENSKSKVSKKNKDSKNTSKKDSKNASNHDNVKVIDDHTNHENSLDTKNPSETVPDSVTQTVSDSDPENDPTTPMNHDIDSPDDTTKDIDIPDVPDMDTTSENDPVSQTQSEIASTIESSITARIQRIRSARQQKEEEGFYDKYVQQNVYIERSLAEQINQLAKQGKKRKGEKMRIYNDALKLYLEVIGEKIE